MVRHLLVIVLATCWIFAVVGLLFSEVPLNPQNYTLRSLQGAIAESSSGELHPLSQNDLHVNSREGILNDEHRRFARQATTKKVTTKNGGTTKKGTTKKANLVAVIIIIYFFFQFFIYQRVIYINRRPQRKGIKQRRK